MIVLDRVCCLHLNIVFAGELLLDDEVGEGLNAAEQEYAEEVEQQPTPTVSKAKEVSSIFCDSWKR